MHRVVLGLELDSMVDAEGDFLSADQVGFDVVYGSLLGAVQHLIRRPIRDRGAVIAHPDEQRGRAFLDQISAQLEAALIGGNVSL